MNEHGPSLRQNSFSITSITQWRSAKVYCINELHIHFFDFLISRHFTNQITLQQSVASKLNLIFKVSQTKREIFHFAPTWGIKNEARMGKLLKGVTQLLQNFEMNLMPVLLLYFSSYRSIKTWNLYFKNMEKKAIRWCIETPKHFHY